MIKRTIRELIDEHLVNYKFLSEKQMYEVNCSCGFYFVGNTQGECQKVFRNHLDSKVFVDLGSLKKEIEELEYDLHHTDKYSCWEEAVNDLLDKLDGVE